jgi:hypothetical protein
VCFIASKHFYARFCFHFPTWGLNRGTPIDFASLELLENILEVKGGTTADKASLLAPSSLPSGTVFRRIARYPQK